MPRITLSVCRTWENGVLLTFPDVTEVFGIQTDSKKKKKKNSFAYVTFIGIDPEYMGHRSDGEFF